MKPWLLFSVSLGALYLLLRSDSGGDVGDIIRNPKNSKEQKAIDFRKAFFWGNPAKSSSVKKISPVPDVGVKLGDLCGVIYKAKKKGNKGQYYQHDFEGALPSLVMDIDNENLHIVGGSYGVTEDGIVG